MSKSLISVVMPTYNSRAFISLTLDSLLNQTCLDFELIIADDGSSDGSVEFIENYLGSEAKFPYEILKLKHLGPGAARNIGAEKANNEWLSFLDSDDLWMADRIEKMKDFIIRETNADIICHGEIMVDGDNSTQLPHWEKFDRGVHPFLSTLRLNSFSPSATVLKKEVFFKAGQFDTNLPSAQDFDLWLRVTLIPHLNIYFLEEYLGKYIIRGGSISFNIQKRLNCVLRIGEKYHDNIKNIAPHPIYEILTYKSRAYSTSGLAFLKSGQFFKGFYFVILGNLIMPRFDWLTKLLKKIKLMLFRA